MTEVPHELGMTTEETRRLSIPDFIALMELSGGTITEEEIQATISAGAPVNEDGTIDLQQYGAWLVEDAKAK